jgi:hypothetical protein
MTRSAAPAQPAVCIDLFSGDGTFRRTTFYAVDPIDPMMTIGDNLLLRKSLVSKRRPD